MRLDEVTPLLTPNATARLPAWRVGQILDAVVTHTTNVGTATLNVNNLSIDVRSELPLILGSRLLLEIAQTGTQILLRVLTPLPPKDAIAEALRLLAPRQSELAPVLTKLAEIARPPPMGGVSVALAAAPPELRELAKTLIERIRTPAQTATADGLKQAVSNAGTFLEHQLATAADPAATASVFKHDLKAGLLQLAAYLKTILPQATAPGGPPTPPPPLTAHSAAPTAPPATLSVNTPPFEILAKETDAALARITTQQLLSIPEHRSDTPQWIFDLPVRSGERVDIFHLHIFREKHPRGPKQAPAWCVRLSFDLVTLGKVSALVTLLADTVSVALWAQQDQTARLFTHHLAALRSELQTAGVVISHLQCECGDAPFAPDAPLKQKRSNLIDERA